MVDHEGLIKEIQWKDLHPELHVFRPECDADDLASNSEMLDDTSGRPRLFWISLGLLLLLSVSLSIARGSCFNFARSFGKGIASRATVREKQPSQQQHKERKEDKTSISKDEVCREKENKRD